MGAMHYVPEEYEREHRIHFVEPGSEFIEQVRFMVRTIADRIGHEPPEITPPPKGFLASKLTADQRRMLNTILWPLLALENAVHQNQLRQSVLIEECGEKMGWLKLIARKRQARVLWSDSRFHEACAGWAGRKRVFSLRQDVAHKAAAVFRALNEVGLVARVEDCWRHYLVQRGLLVRRIISIARGQDTADAGDSDQWDWNRIKTVAMSLTAPAPGLAGHQAGAAIDLRLCDLEHGELLDLGNMYAEGGAQSSLDFPYLTPEQWRTRQLFIATMRMGGFKLLRTEDWHASHGDRGMSLEGHILMHRAHYGPIELFDARTGAIRPYDPAFIEGNYLTDAQCEELVRLSRERGGSGTFRCTALELYRRFNPPGGFPS